VTVVDDVSHKDHMSDAITYLKNKVAILTSVTELDRLKRARAKLAQGELNADMICADTVVEGQKEPETINPMAPMATITQPKKATGKVDMEPFNISLFHNFCSADMHDAAVLEPIQDTMEREIKEKVVSILRRAHDLSARGTDYVGAQEEEWAAWSPQIGIDWGEETRTIVGSIVDLEASKQAKGVISDYFHWMSVLLDQEKQQDKFNRKHNKLVLESECPLCMATSFAGTKYKCKMCKDKSWVHDAREAKKKGLLRELLRDVFDLLCADPHTTITIAFAICVPQGGTFAVYDMTKKFEVQDSISLLVNSISLFSC
jgi:hypothetical protein